MKINKKQVQTLQKLAEEGAEQMCFTDEDLIISIYLPDFWDAEFDDESLFHHRTPEYIAAKSVYSHSIKSLLDAGLVENQGCTVNTNRDDKSSPCCWRITAYGRHALDFLQ